MSKSKILLMMGILALLLEGCATTIPAPEPTVMVPKMLKTTIPAGTSIYIEEPALDSAANEGIAPFDHVTGTFPFVQQQGLTNYQKSARLTLVAAGAQISNEPEKAAYILRIVILGGMSIPFPEAYSILFVHYQLENTNTGEILWKKNTYSQAKLEKTGPQMGDKSTLDPAYGRLAAANLRQMVSSLSIWFAKEHTQTGN